MAGTPLRSCTIVLYQPLARMAPYYVAVHEDATGTFWLVSIYRSWAGAEDQYNNLVRHPPVDLDYQRC